MLTEAPLCYNCKKKKATTYRKDDGRYLCKNCFSDWVIDTTRRTVSKEKFFERDDRIIVGLSGGKDSVVLLDILSLLEEKYPSELIAVCIDEGIAGYRDDGLPIAEMNAKRLGVDFYLYSFKDLFGYTLDEIVFRSRELQAQQPSTRQNKLIQHAPCSYCGVFRRKALNLVARKLDGDKIATGHNLNDVSQTILLNLLRGDVTKLLQDEIKPRKTHDLFVPRVKPLKAVSERSLVLYAFYNNLTYHSTECPFAIEAMRLDIRNFLIEIEEKYPGSLTSIKKSFDALLDKNPSNTIETLSFLNIHNQLNTCKICSEPTNSTICKGCQMLETLFTKYD